VAPYFTPQRGDIPAKRWRIHPRAKPVAFCCRGKSSVVVSPDMRPSTVSTPMPQAPMDTVHILNRELRIEANGVEPSL